MIVIKRNQIIVTALVIMVAIAGYLNYTDRTGIKTVNKDNSNELSEIMKPTDFDYEEFAGIGVLNGEINIATKDVDVNKLEKELNTNNNSNEPGTAVFVNNILDSTYFVQAKLDREQARAKQKDMLTEIINNANVDKQQRAECANAMLDIQKRIEKETSAEAMIKAKGFNEAYVRIDDNTVDVVVSKEALSEAEMAQIEDIVVRKTGVTVDNIRISPLKN